jgi:hypothetical protein
VGEGIESGLSIGLSLLLAFSSPWFFSLLVFSVLLGFSFFSQ